MPTAAIAATVTDSILAGHADEIRRLGKRVITDVIEIGKLLSEAKRIAGRADFLPWLERQFGWSEDTAENFIRLSKLSQQIPKVSELNIPLSGLYALAAPNVSEEARDAVIERTAAGEPLTVSEIKRTIKTAKGRKRPTTRPRKSERDDIGPASADELAQLRARVGELEAEVRQRDLTIAGLRRRVSELERALPPVDSEMPGIPDFLRREAAP